MDDVSITGTSSYSRDCDKNYYPVPTVTKGTAGMPSDDSRIKKVLQCYYIMHVKHDYMNDIFHSINITRNVPHKKEQETITFKYIKLDRSDFSKSGLPEGLASSIVMYLNELSIRTSRARRSWGVIDSFERDSHVIENHVVGIEIDTNEIKELYRDAKRPSRSPLIMLNDLLSKLTHHIKRKKLSAIMMSELEELKNTRRTHRFLKRFVDSDQEKYHETMKCMFETLSAIRYDDTDEYDENPAISPYVSADYYPSLKPIHNPDAFNVRQAYAASEVLTYHCMKYNGKLVVSDMNNDFIAEYVKLIKSFGRYAFRVVDYVEDIMSEPDSSYIDELRTDIESRSRLPFDSSINLRGIIHQLMSCMIDNVPVEWIRKKRYNEVKGYVRFMYYNFRRQSRIAIPKKYKRICAYESGQTYAVVNGLIKDHPYSEMILSKHAWMTYFGRIPKNKIIKKLNRTNIELLKTTNSFKYFMKYVNQLDITESDEHVVLALSNLCICFGGRIFDIIPLNSSKSRIHNEGVDITSVRAYTNKEIQWYINSLEIITHKTIRDDDGENINSRILHKILQMYTAINMTLNTPLYKLIKLLSVTKYSRIVNIHFAIECAKHGISESDYSSYEERYLNFKTYESLPQIEFEEGDYKFFKLDYDDPRGLFLGEYTNCCQYIEGAGRACAWYGHHSGNSAFYVVTKKDKIVAQSWAWRNDNVVVFDSVESLDDSNKRTKKIRTIFEKAAKMMLGKLMISAVKVGMGSGAFSEGDYEKCGKSTTPEGVYTDAKSQHLLSSIKCFVDRSIDTLRMTVSSTSIIDQRSRIFMQI